MAKTISAMLFILMIVSHYLIIINMLHTDPLHQLDMNLQIVGNLKPASFLKFILRVTASNTGLWSVVSSSLPFQMKHIPVPKIRFASLNEVVADGLGELTGRTHFVLSLALSYGVEFLSFNLIVTGSFPTRIPSPRIDT
jgi:hypothetical protein